MIRWTLRIALLLVLPPLFYVSAASLLSLFNPLSSPIPVDEAIEIQLISNGLHVDLVLPAEEWRRLSATAHEPVGATGMDRVAIGWGDRDFYLSTPSWSDMDLRLAWTALWGSGRGVLHASYFRSDWLPADAYRMHVSRETFKRLADYIRASLVWRDGRPVPVAGAGYTDTDLFFEAQGGYNAFNTCNAWLGRGLREAGRSSNPWTPLAWNLVGFAGGTR